MAGPGGDVAQAVHGQAHASVQDLQVAAADAEVGTGFHRRARGDPFELEHVRLLRRETQGGGRAALQRHLAHLRLAVDPVVAVAVDAAADAPGAGGDVPAGHRRLQRHVCHVPGDHLEAFARGRVHQQRHLLGRAGAGEAPAHGVPGETLVALERDAAQAQALQELAGRLDAVAPPVALGVHVLALGLGLDAFGMQGFQIRFVAAQLPRGDGGEAGVALVGGGDQLPAPVLLAAEHVDDVLAQVGQRAGAATLHAVVQRLQVAVVAAPAPRRPERVHDVAGARTLVQFATPGLAGGPVDLVGQRPAAGVVGIGVGEVAVGQSGDQGAAGRVGVVLAQQERRVQRRERVGLLPLPVRLAVDLVATEPVAGEQQVALRVAQDDALVERAHRFHQPLDGQRVAPVEVEHGAVGVDAFLVGVQFVGLDGAQAVGEHAVAVHRVGQCGQRGIEAVRLHAHQRQPRPLLGQVGVVGNAAAEVAVLDLAVVDPPVDEAAHAPEVLQLPERPQRHALRWLRLLERRPALAVVADVVPVQPAQRVVRVHPQQVAEVGIYPRVQALALGGGVFLHQETPVVAHLVEAVGDMLPQRLAAVLEHQPHLGAVQRGGVEAGRGRGDGDPQAVGGKDAVAQVQPQRARLPGADRDRHVDHVARRPDRVLDADVQRDHAAAGAVVGGGQVQRRQVDGDAVQAIVHVLPAVRPAADQRLRRRGVADPGRHQYVDDGPRLRRKRVGASLARTGTLGQRHHHAALVRCEAAIDVVAQRGDVGVVRQHAAVDQVALPDRALRLGGIAHVVAPDLLDRRFLLGIGKAQRAAGLGGELIDAADHAPRPGEQGAGIAAERAEGGTADLDAVDGFAIGHGQVQVLATFDIGVPVRQLEVVVAAGQARAVVDAGPGGLGDAVGPLPHPLLLVLDVGELDLADRRHRRVQERRRRALPAVTVPPRTLRGSRGLARVRCCIACQCGHAGGVEHAVIDADLVEIAAAQEVVAALHLVGRHHPPGQAELVERGVVVAGGIHACHFAAVEEQAHALVLVPGEGDVLPLVGRRVAVQAEGDTGPRQVGIGDEGIETVAVPVDAQPGHVPAAVVGVADAEDHERRLAHGVARAPEERQGAAFGADVARCVPRQHAVVFPADRAAMGTVVDQAHLVLEVGNGIALRLVGDEALVGRYAEQQVRRGRKRRRRERGRQRAGQQQGTRQRAGGTW